MSSSPSLVTALISSVYLLCSTSHKLSSRSYLLGTPTTSVLFFLENHRFSVVSWNCLAASLGCPGCPGCPGRQNYFSRNQVFWTISSEQCLLNNSSSASEVDMNWSAARNTLNPSLFARRYLYFFPTSGYSTGSQCWLMRVPDFTNAYQC